MPSPAGTTTRHGHVRSAVALVTLFMVLAYGCKLLDAYLSDPSIPRPHDFLQVWAAGRLALARENPYDARLMYELQIRNRGPVNTASMMWVPPWGLAVAIPIGALPINLAQMLWVCGQVVLIFCAVAWLWKLSGGRPEPWWCAVALAAAFGPVWQ